MQQKIIVLDCSSSFVTNHSGCRRTETNQPQTKLPWIIYWQLMAEAPIRPDSLIGKTHLHKVATFTLQLNLHSWDIPPSHVTYQIFVWALWTSKAAFSFLLPQIIWTCKKLYLAACMFLWTLNSPWAWDIYDMFDYTAASLSSVLEHKETWRNPGSWLFCCFTFLVCHFKGPVCRIEGQLLAEMVYNLINYVFMNL